MLYHDMTAGKGDKTGDWYKAIKKVRTIIKMSSEISVDTVSEYTTSNGVYIAGHILQVVQVHFLHNQVVQVAHMQILV